MRLRPVPELGHCLAYTPARPALHRLNPSAWLLAELADGRDFTAIATDYAAAMAEAGGSGDLDDAAAGLGTLITLGIVAHVPKELAQGGRHE